MRIATQVVQFAKDLPPADEAPRSAKTESEKSLSAAGFTSPGEK
jgi:hypothetical protein